MSLTFPVAWDSQKDVPNILCVAKCSCSLCGDKGIRAPSPHTPLLRLDPASWAELGRAVLILMALKRLGCGDLAMQECRGTHMQGYGDAGTQDFRDVGVRGVPTHLLIHRTPLLRW